VLAGSSRLGSICLESGLEHVAGDGAADGGQRTDPQRDLGLSEGAGLRRLFRGQSGAVRYGYAYAVGYNGQVAANGYGFARSPNEPQNGNKAFTPTTRCNLASISKAITGIALEVLIRKYPSVTLDTPFWPLISSMVPNPDPSVKPVTLRNLATMKSGMLTPPDEGPLSGNLWPYLNMYLAQPLVGTPGVTYSYNNENFTILQGVIDQVTGQDYVTWVTQNVLVPAGIDTSIFNPNPDPIATATLLYGGPSDTRDGDYFGPLDFVAPGGWISTAQELLKFRWPCATPALFRRPRSARC